MRIISASPFPIPGSGSGDSLMEGARITKDWGIPAYFSNFRKVYGTRSVEIQRGPVNSGDFVESDARY
jgi:hypothetical protein